MPRQTKLSVVPDAPMSGVEPSLYYQVPNWAAIKAIRAKLTSADWCVWSYLQMLDPYGDRLIDVPNPKEIATTVGLSEKQVKRSVHKLEEMGLWESEILVMRGKNLAAKALKESRRETKDKVVQIQHQTKLSAEEQSCPQEDKVARRKTKLPARGQSCPNRSSKPAQSKDSTTSQTIQTNKTIQTLSENKGENISEEEKISQVTIDIDQPKEDSAITVKSSLVDKFSGFSTAREKHELLTYAGDDTPWLNPPRRRNDINFKQEFMQWHGVRWMLKFTKRDIHEAIADFRSSLLNNPDKIPGRWEEYQSHIIHHAENIKTRLEAGIEISSEEQQKMLTHLPVVSATSVNIPTINGSAENPAAYLPFVPPQFTLAQLQKMHGSKWREAAEHFGYSQEEIEEFDFQSF
ncbi:MAG: hypothetical protein ACM37W_17835 [Actinomycetota bacterium]